MAGAGADDVLGHRLLLAPVRPDDPGDARHANDRTAGFCKQDTTPDRTCVREWGQVMDPSPAPLLAGKEDLRLGLRLEDHPPGPRSDDDSVVAGQLRLNATPVTRAR